MEAWSCKPTLLLFFLFYLILMLPNTSTPKNQPLPNFLQLKTSNSKHFAPQSKSLTKKFIWSLIPITYLYKAKYLTKFKIYRGDPLPRPIPAVGLINTYDAVTEATSSATVDTLVKRDSSGDFAGTTISATTFIGALTGHASSATDFTGNLVGDVTGTQGATVVATIGGKTATEVANTVTTVAAATSEATPDTLVMRDSYGDVSLNQITGGYFELSGGGRFSAPIGGEGIYIEPDLELESGATLSFATPDNMTKITIQPPTTMVVDYTLTLPTTDGTNGYALTTNGSGVLSWTNLSTPSGTILQDGNSFDTAITIGTNDNYGLNLETNGTNRLSITNSGAISTTGNASVGGTLSSAGALTVSANGASIAGGATITGDSSIEGDLTLADRGQIRLTEYAINGNNYVALQAPFTLAANYTLSLPNSLGGDGYALTTDEYGNLSWTDLSTPSGIIFQNGNLFGGPMTIGTNDAYGLNLETWGTTHLTIDNSGNFALNTDKFTVAATTGNTAIAGTLSSAGALTISSNGANITGNSTIDGNLTLEDQGQIQLAESTTYGTNYVAIQAPEELTSNYTLTLPSDAGTDGYALTTNGSGVLNWTDLSTPSGVVLQGGNSFGEAMTIGTNDNYALNLETNNTTRVTIANDGAISTTSNLSIDGTLTSANALTVSADGAAITGNSSITGTLSVSSDFSIATNKLTVAGATGNTAIAGTLSSENALTVSSGGAAITGNSTVTGTLDVTSSATIDGILYPTGGIEAKGTGGGGSGIINIGITDDTDTINLGTGTTAQTINLGTGSGASAINIGSTGDTINIYGDTYYNHVTELQVADKLITINKGGAAASGANSGIEVEEDSSIAGYLKTSGDRASWLTKAPASAGIVTITPGTSGFTLNQGVATTDSPTFTGVTISAQGDLILQDADSSNSIALQAPAIVGADVTLTLPDTAGTNGYALTTNGSGALGWAAVAHDGGNALGAALTLGTNDTYALNLETDGTTRITISDAGAVSTTGNLSVGGTLSSTGDFSVNTNKFTVAATTGNTSIGGTLTMPDNAQIKNNSGDNVIITNKTLSNFFFGIDAGNTSATGSNNVGIGKDSLSPITSGFDNTAVGCGAGKSIRGGNQHVAIGKDAMNLSMSGLSNVAVGVEALGRNTSSSLNVAVGYKALNNLGANVSNNNVAIGNSALGGAASTGSLGYRNIAIGDNAGRIISGGENSITIGASALYNTNNASNSITIGYQAGYNCTGTSNTHNIYIGTNQKGANENNTIRIGSWNDAYDTLQTTDCYIETPQATINNPAGSASLHLKDGSANPTTWSLTAGAGTSTDLTIAQNSTTKVTVSAAGEATLTGDLTLPATTSTVGAIKAGSDLLLHTYNSNSNLFVGRTAGNRTGTGTTNTGCGYAALNVFGTGGANTAVGYAALEDLSSGNYNTAVGAQTLKNLTTGQYNTAVGDQAMTGIVTGSENIALAHRSLEDVTSGIRNIGIGNASLSNVTTGSYNTAIGHVSGMNLGTGGNYNIYLGYRQLGSSGDTGITRIGALNDSSANATTKCFIQGIRDVTTDSTDREVVGIDSSHQLGTEGAMKVGSSGYLPAIPLPSAITPRILYGRVSSTGSKINGSDGWTVSRTSDPGQYRVSFSNSFSAVPATVATIGDQSISANFMIQVVNESTSSVDIYIFVPGASFYNNAFNFQVIGY